MLSEDQKNVVKMVLEQDLNNLKDGDSIILYPNKSNPLHKKPIKATFQGGYFYCDGSRSEDGPDYYWRDVLLYNSGWKKD